MSERIVNYEIDENDKTHRNCLAKETNGRTRLDEFHLPGRQEKLRRSSSTNSKEAKKLVDIRTIAVEVLSEVLHPETSYVLATNEEDGG